MRATHRAARPAGERSQASDEHRLTIKNGQSASRLGLSGPSRNGDGV